MGYASKRTHSILGRNEILIHAITWINLEKVKLTEKSYSQKDKYCKIPLGKFIETESRMVITKGLRGEGLLFNGYRVLSEMMRSSGNGQWWCFACLCEYTKWFWVVYFINRAPKAMKQKPAWMKAEINDPIITVGDIPTCNLTLSTTNTTIRKKKNPRIQKTWTTTLSTNLI